MGYDHAKAWMRPKPGARTSSAYPITVSGDARCGGFSPRGMLSLASDAGCLTCATVFPGSMVPRTFVTVTLRPLAAHDFAAVRLLADATLRVVPHGDPFRAALDDALRLAGDAHRGIVALDASGLIGLIVFGETAGAQGAGRIAFVAVDPRARRRAVATALIEA